MDADLAFLPAYLLRQRIVDKAISPLELTHFFLRRIQLLDPQLKAFITVTEEDALQSAKDIAKKISKGDASLPLLGIPIVFSDIYNIARYPTTFASVSLKQFIMKEDSPEIKVLRAAGTIFLGKTNLSEFSFYPSTENQLVGSCSNPWNLAYSTGSSGGIATAVATGLAPLGLGADVHGGIRISGACCGLFSLKITRGLLPVQRPYLTAAAERKFYHTTLLARHPKDLTILLEVLAHQMISPQQSLNSNSNNGKHSLGSLKIGWSSDLGFLPVTSSVQEQLRKTLSLFDGPHRVQHIPMSFDESTLLHFQNLLSADRLLSFIQLKSQYPEFMNSLTPYTQEWIKKGERTKGIEYSLGLIHCEWIKREINTLFDQYDLLIVPVMGVSALPMPLPTPKDLQTSRLLSFLPLWGFTIPFNLSGHPVLTAPCGMTEEGIPFGIQIAAKYFHEKFLLQIADWLDQQMQRSQWHPDLIIKPFTHQTKS